MAHSLQVWTCRPMTNTTEPPLLIRSANVEELVRHFARAPVLLPRWSRRKRNWIRPPQGCEQPWGKAQENLHKSGRHGAAWSMRRHGAQAQFHHRFETPQHTHLSQKRKPHRNSCRQHNHFVGMASLKSLSSPACRQQNRFSDRKVFEKSNFSISLVSK